MSPSCDCNSVRPQTCTEETGGSWKDACVTLGLKTQMAKPPATPHPQCPASHEDKAQRQGLSVTWLQVLARLGEGRGGRMRKTPNWRKAELGVRGPGTRVVLGTAPGALRAG